MVSLISCKDTNLKIEKGFLLFIDPEHWYYVPATELSKEQYLNQFETKNLSYGIQFRPFFEGRDKIIKSLDTLRIDNYQIEMAEYLSTLKIAPVKIKYEVAAEKIPSHSIFNFSCKVLRRQVDFKFSTLHMKIIEVHPLFNEKGVNAK
jgi:hypothetical protein